MKAGNKNKTPEEVKLTGEVVLEMFAEGSKSEHKAVCLKTGSEKYVMRRQGGNPFFDAALQKLVGKKITAKGTINDYLFIATDIEIED